MYDVVHVFIMLFWLLLLWYLCYGDVCARGNLVEVLSDDECGRLHWYDGSGDVVLRML